jgi:hypothetical protein
VSWGFKPLDLFAFLIQASQQRMEPNRTPLRLIINRDMDCKTKEINKMKRKWILFALAGVLVLLSLGCSPVDPLSPEGELEEPPAETPSSEPVPGGQAEEAAPTPDRTLRLTETKVPEQLEPVDLSQPEPVVGEVPADLREAVMDDLLQRSAVKAEDLKVLRAESVTWNDGSLGCPQPGVFYTQALVPGYWLVIEAGGTAYDYRLTASGSFTLCENSLPLIEPPTTPDA